MEGRGVAVLIEADGCEFVSVNYDTLELAIAAAAFDWQNFDITPEHFPNAPHEQGETHVETKLYHFGKDMSSDKVVAEMDKDGFRPATLRELLAFAVKNPDEQRKYAIVGLGSVWSRGGDRDVPFLCLDGYERGLSLYWWSDRWHGYCRFLAVRKS